MRVFIICFLVAAAGLLAVSCGKDHGTEPGPFEFDDPPVPVDLTVTSGPGSVTVEWSYPAGELGRVEEFRVYYWVEAFDAVELAGTTPTNSFVDSRLVGNLEYCYMVSAVDTSGMEGYRSGPECAVTDPG